MRDVHDAVNYFEKTFTEKNRRFVSKRFREYLFGPYVSQYITAIAQFRVSQKKIRDLHSNPEKVADIHVDNIQKYVDLLPIATKHLNISKLDLFWLIKEAEEKIR